MNIIRRKFIKIVKLIALGVTCKKKLLTMILILSLFATCKAAKFDPPTLTAEFDQMAFMQLYATYSWEPRPNTEFYQVQILRYGRAVREMFNTEGFNRVTDSEPLIETGVYSWKVRVVDKNHQPLNDWSEEKTFSVVAPMKFAVLGDSISHGGADYIPASQISCQWETFCDIPIKNLARSGDTTTDMLNRFDNDVLPFKPEVLLIMAGVNDIRLGFSADAVIKNLELLREKCLANEITPIFCTITSMNPKKIRAKLTDGDWLSEREKINHWIMYANALQHRYCERVD